MVFKLGNKAWQIGFYPRPDSILWEGGWTVNLIKDLSLTQRYTIYIFKWEK